MSTIHLIKARIAVLFPNFLEGETCCYMSDISEVQCACRRRQEVHDTAQETFMLLGSEVATRRKVAGSIPDKVMDLILPAAIRPCG
jgi:hypothetical protein